MTDTQAAILSRAVLELKQHIEKVEARAVCAELMIEALVRSHADVPQLVEDWKRALVVHAGAARESPVLGAAFDRLAVFVRAYGADEPKRAAPSSPCVPRP